MRNSKHTGIYFSPNCLKHNPGPDRAIAPARLNSVMDAIKSSDFTNVEFCDAQPASINAINAFHTQEYIDTVLAPIPEGKDVAFDFETTAVTGTAEAALNATGLVLKATEDVINGKKANAFCLASPGGHHAEADMAIGYCFFNHIAIAAITAQRSMGQKRVAVLDIDNHHGNGTQSAFWNYENRLFVSLHEDNPLSGFANEHGAWDNIMNIPLPCGSDGKVFREAINSEALPKISSFKPDIFFISAGFDMHKDDPLGSLNLDIEDYFWLGSRLRKFSDNACDGKLVAVMEGGYDLTALGESAAAFVGGLAGE